MKIEIDVPQESEQRVLDAFCADRLEQDSQQREERGEDPLTPLEFVTMKVRDYVNGVVTDYEHDQAAAEARRAAQASGGPAV